MSKLIIIAALEREIAPLVAGWPSQTIASQNREVRIFETEDAVVALAGMGTVNARIAAGAAYHHAQHRAARFISAGLAGALIPELEVGEILTPALVVDDVDGGEIATSGGSGTLVTASGVAGMEAKQAMALQRRARAVDMEAYAVADVARIYGIPFIAVKAISDRLDFPMPPLGRFVSATGQFQTAKFAVYTVMRPWLWSTVMALGRNSAKAAENLCARLRQMTEQHAAGLYNSKETTTQA